MKYHHNIKCDCGHRQLSHNNNEGQCKLCGCTWFYPNVNYKRKPKIKGVIKIKGQNDITIEYMIKNYQQDIKQLQTMIKEKQQQIKKLKRL